MPDVQLDVVTTETCSNLISVCKTHTGSFLPEYKKLIDPWTYLHRLLPTDSTRLSDVPYELRVRLVGGQYPSQGRVEVYCNGQWGTICSTSRFGATEAETVCRQLGYTDVTGYNHLNL